MTDRSEAASKHPEPERPERHAVAHGPARAKRASRGLVRVWAWAIGAFSFLSPFALFGLFPKPAVSAAEPTSTPVAAHRRPVVVVITKKIVYTHSASSSTTSSGPVNYVYAPAAPAVATSCGTHPC